MPLVVCCMLIYAATNLVIFGLVSVVSRKTHSGEISRWGGLFLYAPCFRAKHGPHFTCGHSIIWRLFGQVWRIPPTLTSGSIWGYAFRLIGAVNSVVAFGHYGSVKREIWMKPVPDGDTTPIRVPGSLKLALVLTAATALVLGILPGVAMHFGDIARLTSAFDG